ncbi:MAG: DUF11 domain-containing protein [Verrucomicrobiota bacterium]
MKKLLSIAMLVLLSRGVCPATSDALISVADSPDPVRVGKNLTYAIAVTNVGPDTVTNAVVTDVMPAAANFVSCSLSQGTYSQVADIVTCNLGNLSKGATAAVTIVVSPTLDGTITNDVSITGDTQTGNDRTATTTTVLQVNHAPVITFNPPGPFVLPVGATTSFVVEVTDNNRDPVLLTNPTKPSGSTFDGTNFTWTAPASATNTTNLVVFVANDQQGETNSITTNTTTIMVPFDWDTDGMGDGWEWTKLGSLTNTPTGDYDGDGANNYFEYVSGTEPASSTSVFRVRSVVTPQGQSNHQVTVWTVPNRKYTMYFTDQRLSNNAPWSAFANTNYGVWIETALNPTNHVFLDNESVNTTGGPPPNGGRVYRVKVGMR